METPDKLRTVALIPLRGGSKSIPLKNIKEIAGHPLAYWVCKAAAESSHINDVYVSTEDAKIKEIVESFVLGVTVINRPPALAKDESSTESVMFDFMRQIPDFDILVTLQATSPLTTSKDINSALEKFRLKGFDSMFTGVLSKRFLWTLGGKPLNYDYTHRPRRQDFEGLIVENGAFYITRKEILRTEKNRLGGKIGVYEMPGDTLTELDEPSDWDIVERILLARHS